MNPAATHSFGTQLKALREAAGFTQEELASIAGLSVHAVSALERGQRRRPHVDTVRALSAALDLTGAARDALIASARPAPPTAADELSGSALPLPPTALLGRERDVETLKHWLADPAARLITLIGPGGVGKTRLALEIASAIADEATRRVVFVSLAALRDPAFVAVAIAEGLGLADVSAVDLPKRARIACESQPTLLVLDNFEQVVDAAPLVADLLSAAAPLGVLVTSRAPLRLRGEREFVVEPLALEAEAPALRLFVERVRDVRPDFQLTVSNSRTMTAICQRLDALPLAIELAAPWLKVLTPDDLFSRLEHDALLPTTGTRDLPARQQTITATVAWSYQLLDRDEQRAFRRLGVLPDRFPIDAAAAVLADRDEEQAVRAIAGLIDKSLLRAETADDGRAWYSMLETVRAYAALELGTADEHDDAMEGLVRYCTHQGSLAAEGLVGPAQAEWLDRVQRDLESARVALAWVIDRGRSGEAVVIASGLAYFWLFRGHAAEGLRWCERILSMPALAPALESSVLVGAALMEYMQGEHGRAAIRLDRALLLAGADGDTRVIAHAESMYGHIEHARGNLREAYARFSRGIEAFRAAGLAWGTGSALSGMAGAVLAAGDVAHAERLLDEATALLRHGGPWFLTPVLCFRAVLAVHRGDAHQVLVLMRESLGYIRTLQDKYAFVYALLPLAAAAVLKGDDRWAARLLGARDAVAERTGATVAVAIVHDLRDRTERDVRARLGSERWAAAYAEGRTASLDALLMELGMERSSC